MASPSIAASGPSSPLPLNIEETIIRVFGSLQAQTQSALIFDTQSRKELFAFNAQFRWVCEVAFDAGLGTDALLLTPSIVAAAATNGGASPHSPSSSSAGEGLVPVGVLASDWVDADGTEDPVKWVQRTAINPGGSLQSAPHSLPIAFGSEHPTVRAAKAAAKGIDGAQRALAARQRLAEEAGVDVSELDDAMGVSPSSRPGTASSPPVNGGVEPALRCPLQLRTYVQLRIPRGPLFATTAGGTITGKQTTAASSPTSGKANAASYTNGSYNTDTAEDPFANTSPIASLPASTSYVACLTDLGIRPLLVKTQLTRRDVTVGLKDVLAQDAVYSEASRKAAEEAKGRGRSTNPYAVDEGPLEGEAEGSFGFATEEEKRRKSSMGGGLLGADGAILDDSSPERDDAICGYSNIRVSFADLSIAIAPIVSVRPDVTTVTSSTALMTATSNANRDEITRAALDKDLLRCNFINVRSIVPAKVLEWSLAPRTITYGCMPLTELYRHLLFFYAIAAVRLASPEALAGNAKKAPVRPYQPLVTQLASHRPSCYRDPISGAYRWDTLTSLSLFHYILGDCNVLPVLSLMVCCRGLEFADFNTNALTTISMKRIFEVLRRHPSIRTVDLSGNTFFESAGDEILRLVKANTNIVGCATGNNHFTERLGERIARQTAANAELLKEDPLNFLSPNYSYLRSSTDIPAEVWMAVHQLWVTLIAAPLDAHPKAGEDSREQKITQREREKVLGVPATAVVAAQKSLIIPLSAEVPAVVAAPLFAESMRHVQIEVLSRLTQDRIIRGLFRDFAAHQGEQLMELELPTLQEIERKGVAPDGALGMPRYSRSYAKMLVTALNATLGSAGRSADDRQLAWRDTVRMLQGLGEHQYNLGCRPWHLMFANRAFMDWLKSVLGPSMMDAVTQASLAQVLALISRAVVSGTPLPTAL